MDAGRLLYRVVAIYVACLVVGGLLTGVWLFAPAVVARPTVAVLWFSLGGFGFLVLVTFGLLTYFET
ncbi:hypothetical protein EFA46_007140 [Halarchaeum sp. CBA1220]|uniref:hypothetical protein n=1 Tax=Halarchaeum sp. CBA1220 TaxID=1853682 RepID=UPI000F3A8201|nr:hypothetical protein [Halarchaeum sp. CBA1220]QLC33986.1 hypothetical protein EFA46_007140 [Halarchaeum sp. CBA1220]